MLRKKLIAVLLLVAAVFLPACNLIKKIDEINTKRDERKKAVLAIQGAGKHYLINEEGYVIDNKQVYFSDLIRDKTKKDGFVLPEPDDAQTKRYEINANLYHETVYFTMRYFVSDDDKTADVLVGYVDIPNEEITYYNTRISTNEEYGIYLMPNCANENYFIFRQPREYYRKDVYYIIDKSNNALLERISDAEPYKDGTENQSSVLYFNDEEYKIVENRSDGANELCYGEQTLTIDYEYVLARSEKMRQIDEIIGKSKGEVRENLISYGNRLYVVMESVYEGFFGRGDLMPVVFEYNFQTDAFDYIGATEFNYRNAYIFGIIPEN